MSHMLPDIATGDQAACHPVSEQDRIQRLRVTDADAPVADEGVPGTHSAIVTDGTHVPQLDGALALADEPVMDVTDHEGAIRATSVASIMGR